MNPSFSVSVAGTGDEFLITCQGEFDLASADRFRHAIAEALDARPRHVHLDCSAVTFIDSIGIRALLHTAARCKDDDVILTLNMSPVMRRVFDTVGATPMFILVP